MNSTNAQSDLIALLAGEIDVATLASRHGVTEEEALRWRSVFVAGMKASVAGQGVGRRSRSRWVLLAGTVVATAAFAQLTVFAPNQPALASEVNGNFNQLRTWLETKVGAVSNANIVTTNSVTAANVTATSTVSGVNVNGGTVTSSARVIGQSFAPIYSNWNSVSTSFTGGAGIVNDNVAYQALMVVGNSSAGGVRRVSLYDDVEISSNLIANNNAWGAINDIATGGFGTPNGVVFTTCGNGRFVCGVGLGHTGNDSNYWTGARLTLRCCAL